MPRPLVALLAIGAFAAPAMAQEVNLYSSRHYDGDEWLYTAFEDATGITVNRIEGNADELLQRILVEGDNSPADVFLTVDAGRIWRADQEGILDPVASDVLERQIPAHLRHPDGHWFGMSQRARIIFYAKDRVENPPQTYEALADPQYDDMICIRSSTNIYNQSLLASIIEADGEEAAKQWAAGVLDNMARSPQGGDTDQLRGIVSGECDIAVSNTYYFMRALMSDVDGLTGSTDEIGWVFPNQSDRGAHMNVAAAGVVKGAPNRDNAVAFLEFLTTPAAQEYFANQNNEYPAVPGTSLGEAPATLGLFRQDDMNLNVLGENQGRAQQIFNEVGWP